MGQKIIPSELGKSSSFHYDWVTKFIDPNQKLKILDFGSGNGNLLRCLSKNSALTLVGADKSSKPTDLPQNIDWVSANLNDPLPDKWNNYFDVVFAVEVIEHLENPRNIIRNIKKLLKPGGKVILTTPNTTSLRSLVSLMIRGHHVDFLDNSYPEHITPLVPKDIERILKENLFSDIKTEFSNRGCVPGWTAVTWQNLSFNLLSGSKFSDHLLVTAKNEA